MSVPNFMIIHLIVIGDHFQSWPSWWTNQQLGYLIFVLQSIESHRVTWLKMLKHWLFIANLQCMCCFSVIYITTNGISLSMEVILGNIQSIYVTTWFRRSQENGKRSQRKPNKTVNLIFTTWDGAQQGHHICDKELFLRNYVQLLAFSKHFDCIPQHSSANGVSLCCGLMSPWALRRACFRNSLDLSKSKVNLIWFKDKKRTVK